MQRRLVCRCSLFTNKMLSICTEWEEAYNNLRETLGLPLDEPIPKMPRRDLVSTTQLASFDSNTLVGDTKRKAPDDDDDDSTSATVAEVDHSKRSKNDAIPPPTNVNGTTNGQLDTDTVTKAASAVAAFIPFLTPDDLLPPKLPSKQEMEDVLLKLRKKALVEEYFGE